jgi:predicted DNA-binding transcriptional regulator YafY
VAKGAVVMRWFQLLMHIQAMRTATAQELAERTGVSVRTIFRDLAGMQAAHIPIYYDEHLRTYRVAEGFQMRPLQLTTEDVYALVVALNFMRRTWAPAKVEALMDKLLAGLPEPQKEVAGAIDRALVVDPVGARTEEDEEIARQLQEAINQQKKVQIRYVNFHQGGREELRTVQPYGIALRGIARYLIAYCDSRGAIRHFRLGRIKEVRLLPKSFKLPKGFDLNRYLDEIFGITGGEAEVPVRLRFRPSVAHLVLETRWHPSQVTEPQADGSVLVHLRPRGLDELARWVVTFGEGVVVEEPAALRNLVRSIALGALAANPATDDD